MEKDMTDKLLEIASENFTCTPTKLFERAGIFFTGVVIFYAELLKENKSIETQEGLEKFIDHVLECLKETIKKNMVKN